MGGGGEFSESSAFRDFNKKKKRQKACNKTIVFTGSIAETGGRVTENTRKEPHDPIGISSLKGVQFSKT